MIDRRALLDAGSGTPRPGAVQVLAIDPCGGEADLGRRDVVVVEALRDVEDLILLHSVIGSKVVDHGVEIAPGGLVGPDVLGGVDGLERDPELPAGSGKAGAVDIGEHDQAETPVSYTSDAADDLTRVDLGGRRI